MNPCCCVLVILCQATIVKAIPGHVLTEKKCILFQMLRLLEKCLKPGFNGSGASSTRLHGRLKATTYEIYFKSSFIFIL